MNKERYLTSWIREDALKSNKMAFISGPRQVGKSTLGKALLNNDSNYFLYDNEDFRKSWMKSPDSSILLREQGPILLDEIHKDRNWKRKLKGIYDSSKDLEIIVTGSARFSYFRKGSDSLLGRYLPYRLHPFSVAESTKSISPDKILENKITNYPWNDLLNLGGFPESLLSGTENTSKRWSRLRKDRLILEDSRDFRNISDQNALRALSDLLPEKVGSLLSVNSLKEDVGKAYATIREWIKLLDLLYYSFVIRPYSKRINRAIKLEPKLYLYDILQIPKENIGQRRENLAALHLLKACNYWTDTAQGDFELNFIRNKEGKELDFLIVRDRRPWLAVECKSNDKNISKNLVYFSELTQAPHRVQLVEAKNYDKYYPNYKIRVMDYETFFSTLV